MMNNKRFYWIKLKTDFFNQDTIDFLLQQDNGCKYIVLYQMLCLKTANNDGELNTKIGEIIIPYDVEKIQRDTKYFDIDTVRVALELFKRLGLIYQQEDSILKIANFNEIVGSESKWAEKKRIYREKQKQLGQNEDIVRQEIEYRDRDKSIEIDIDKDIDNNSTAKAEQLTLKETKKKYGEYKHVMLKDSELEKLKKDYPNYEELITYLDEYIEMKGYKAKSHYLAIKKWVVDAVNERKRSKPLPKWFNKENKESNITNEEKEELDEILESLGG